MRLSSISFFFFHIFFLYVKCKSEHHVTFNLSSANATYLVKSKIVLFGKLLKVAYLTISSLLQETTASEESMFSGPLPRARAFASQTGKQLPMRKTIMRSTLSSRTCWNPNERALSYASVREWPYDA